jgi:hypothetical protein
MADLGDLINQLSGASADQQGQTSTPLGAPPPLPSKLDPLINQLSQAAAGPPPEVAGPPPPPQQPWSGAMLPVSTDAQGRWDWDSNAGVLGGIKRLFQAAAAPGDVYSGKLATPYSGSASSEASPEVTNRALDFAMAFSPASAALRAGEVVPGAAWGTSVPTAQQLKDTAASGYEAARASPASIPGDAVANMAQQMQQSLVSDHGIIEKTAPKTYAILNELANPPTGAIGTYPGLEAARRGLSTLSAEGGTEGFAAQKLIPGLDNFIDTISPEAATARANYAAAMRSNALTGELDKANTGILEQADARAHASHSGTNIDNSIRQRAASFLQNPQNLSGYSQPEVDALNSLVQGGAVRNAARRVGNYFGGGGGLGSLAATAAGAALGGHLAPGFEGTALGAAIPTALGVSAKGLENTLARRALGGVDETVRSRSPLAQSLQSVMVPAMGRSNMLRAPAFAPTPQQAPPSLAQILAGSPNY